MAKRNIEEIAVNLLTCATDKEAAEKSGISPATIKRLKKQEDFQAILTRGKNEMYGETMKRAQSYSAEALETLRAIYNNEAEKGSTRVSAARAILDFGVTMYTDENIIQRLDELERGLNGD